MKDDNEELKHYGVLGMKWGVRRATKSLSSAKTSGDKEKQTKALDSLEKQRMKITKKLGSLEKQGAKLEKRHQNNLTSTNVKVAKLDSQAANLRRKAGGFLTSEQRANKLMIKANKVQVKADTMRSAAAQTKAKLDKNKAIKETFNKALSDVDKTLIANGRKHLENKSRKKK